MTFKIIIASVVISLIALSWYNNETKKEEEERIHHAYYGWLIETEGKISMPYPEWEALYGEKYKHGKP